MKKATHLQIEYYETFILIDNERREKKNELNKKMSQQNRNLLNEIEI